MARKTYIKTLKYSLSLGSSFANTPKIIDHQKFSMGNNKKVAFIPRFAIRKSFLFLARGYKEKNATTSLINLQKKREEDGGEKKRGGHNILHSYIIPMKISSRSAIVEAATVAKGSEMVRTEFWSLVHCLSHWMLTSQTTELYLFLEVSPSTS